MRVAKWGNSLAVRIPASIVEAAGLKEGDDIAVEMVSEPATLRISKELSREEAMERIRALRKPLPPGWKFDREEANSRK